MKLGSFAKAVILLIAPALSALAAAQDPGRPPAGGGTGLDLPGNVQFVGQQEPGLRKATAIVNGDVITGSDIDQRMALIIASNPNFQIPPDEVQRYRAQVLRNLIDETLQIQEAGRRELAVEDREVNSYYERFSGNFRQTAQSFTAYLRSIGSSERSMKRQIRGELSWQRLQRREIEPFVTVGEDEVQAVLSRLEASRGTAEFRVAEIYLSATPETAAEVQANAARIVQQVRAGASFQAYARQVSEATTAATGGDLGWVRPEQLPDELSTLVTQMPVGGVSEPISVSGGYSIVFLVDQRRLMMPDPRDAQLSLMQLTVQLPAGTTPAQAEQRATAVGAEARDMGGCGGAAATAQRLGAELISNDQVRVRDLPAQLQAMLLNLSVGQATPAFGSQERISVLVLCGRDDPPPPTPPTAADVTERLIEQRVSRRAQRYLRDLRRDAVIDYR